MKKHFLLAALLLVSLTGTFVSCSKDKDPEPLKIPDPVKPVDSVKTPKNLLIGTWMVKGTGIDADGNGTLEPSEYDSTSAQFTVKETFSANGSGTASVFLNTQSVASLAFTWSLMDNDQTLRVIQEAQGGQPGDTVYVVITKLTQNQFDSYEKGSSPRNISLLIR